MKQIRDPDFPGLVAALDDRTVLAGLRRTAPECGEDVRVLGVNVMDVRYRPGGPCWILYRLKLRVGDQRSVRQLVAGRVLGRDDHEEAVPEAVRRRYEAQRAKGLVQGLRTPVIRLPEVPMVLYAFPVDTSLPGLFDAVDPEAMRRHFGRMWSRRKVRVRRVHVRPLGYTPHARAAFHYEVLSETKDTGLPEMRRLIGKMHAKKSTARLFADQWALWHAARGRVNLAPPVGFVDTVGLTLQEQMRGQRLGGLVTAPGLRKLVARTARMLATLHGLSAPLSARRRPVEEAQTVHRWAGVLITIRSDLAGRVEALRDRLAAHVEARARLSGPIHADFHHTNVLVDGDEVTIIDLDEMAWGDPMVDVGRFLASLRVPARRAFGDIDGLVEVGELFLEEYLRRAGGEERQARLFEAASLFIAAGSAFRIQRPTWEEEVCELLDEAERVFALASKGVKVAAPARAPRRPALAFAERCRWAADPVYVQAAMAPIVRETSGAELAECRVAVRSSARDRLRYELRGWRGTERWRQSVDGVVRKDGGGRSMIARLDTMRQALAGSSDAPVLPRPLGYVGPLSLVVWEVPGGVRFSDLLDSEEALGAAERLALALAVLHRAPVELTRPPRTLEEELRTLRARIMRVRARFPEFSAAAEDVLTALEQESRAVPVKLGPALRTVHPRHVVCDGTRVGFERVDDITLAHPLLDAGDFLARVTLLGIARQAPRATAAAARFRDAYRGTVVGEGDGLAVFEAGALLRLACANLEGDGGDTARHLVERAAARLGS